MKIKKQILMIAAVVFMAALALTGCKSSAQLAMEAAEQSMDKGNYQNAIDSLSRVIKTADTDDPDDLLAMINAYYLRGDCHAKRGELTEAQADYDQALIEDTTPRSVAVEQTATRCLRRALVYISKEDWVNAADALTQGLACPEINCKQELLRNQVICLEKAGNWEEAKAAAEAYAEAYPDDAEMIKERDFLITR